MIQFLERHIVRDDPNVKELKPLREGLREMMQCDGRQHFAESSGLHEHPRRPSSWKDSTRMKFMKIQMRIFQRGDQNRGNRCGRQRVLFFNSWRIKLALESNFEEGAQKTWDRNLRKTTLLNTCNPLLMETILKVLREQSEHSDQMNTAGELVILIPESLLEWESNLG